MYWYGVPGSSPIADALFSRTQQRVLGVLFGYPLRSFHVGDIAWRVRTGRGALYRVLAAFEAAGLVTSTDEGNQRHYQANRDCPIFVELCAIAVKTVGIADPLRNALLPLSDRIQAAFVCAASTDHGIALVIRSETLDYNDAELALGPVRCFLARDLWFDLLDRAQWGRREREFRGEKIFLLGDEGSLL